MTNTPTAAAMIAAAAKADATALPAEVEAMAALANADGGMPRLRVSKTFIDFGHSRSVEDLRRARSDNPTANNISLDVSDSGSYSAWADHFQEKLEQQFPQRSPTAGSEHDKEEEDQVRAIDGDNTDDFRYSDNNDGNLAPAPPAPMELGRWCTFDAFEDPSTEASAQVAPPPPPPPAFGASALQRVGRCRPHWDDEEDDQDDDEDDDGCPGPLFSAAAAMAFAAPPLPSDLDRMRTLDGYDDDGLIPACAIAPGASALPAACAASASGEFGSTCAGCSDIADLAGWVGLDAATAAHCWWLDDPCASKPSMSEDAAASMDTVQAAGAQLCPMGGCGLMLTCTYLLLPPEPVCCAWVAQDQLMMSGEMFQDQMPPSSAEAQIQFLQPQVPKPLAPGALGIEPLSTPDATRAAFVQRFRWRVHAAKLWSSDRQAVSRPLVVYYPDEESQTRPVEFKIIMRATRAKEKKGGASFKQARGHGALELNCMQCAEATRGGAQPVEFRFGVGHRAWSGPPARHCFGEKAKRSGLPSPSSGGDGEDEEEVEWDLRSEVVESTGTFEVFLEVVAGEEALREARLSGEWQSTSVPLDGLDNSTSLH